LSFCILLEINNFKVRNSYSDLDLETFGISQTYQVSYNWWPIPSFTLGGLVLL
jgi:hypothetical protein